MVFGGVESEKVLGSNHLAKCTRDHVIIKSLSTLSYPLICFVSIPFIELNVITCTFHGEMKNDVFNIIFIR